MITLSNYILESIVNEAVSLPSDQVATSIDKIVNELGCEVNKDLFLDKVRGYYYLYPKGEEFDDSYVVKINVEDKIKVNGYVGKFKSIDDFEKKIKDLYISGEEWYKKTSRYIQSKVINKFPSGVQCDVSIHPRLKNPQPNTIEAYIYADWNNHLSRICVGYVNQDGVELFQSKDNKVSGMLEIVNYLYDNFGSFNIPVVGNIFDWSGGGNHGKITPGIGGHFSITSLRKSMTGQVNGEPTTVVSVSITSKGFEIKEDRGKRMVGEYKTWAEVTEVLDKYAEQL